MPATDDIHDAAIVGGGIVGLAAALALVAAGYRVALVERTPPVRLRGDLGFVVPRNAADAHWGCSKTTGSWT